MRCWIGGVAILGPGLPGWAASEAVLAGAAPWTPAEVAVPPPAMLPATERRRTSLAVRLALAAAAEAAAGEDAAALDTVFASSNGDGAVVGAILETLSDPAGAISPTQFHNSVHNAAAGYWHIAMGAATPSISVGGHDDTVAAGLLQAVAAVAARRRPVLFCAYDAPLPPPLSAVRRTTLPFASAMVLLPEPSAAARATLGLRFGADDALTSGGFDAPRIGDAAPPLTDGALERAEGRSESPGAPIEPRPTDRLYMFTADRGPTGMRSATDRPAADDPLNALAAENPAARALPLLRALAARRAAILRLPMFGDSVLEIEVAPWPP